ncbi:NAD(P)H-dependent oxidoreductase [Rhodoblastus sp.]|uniref:NAD(P)H-dependent oxidoreductase n=1 Tax=Rhodoblastus sp. TaxID=1962975 RepID=UPI003F945793
MAEVTISADSILQALNWRFATKSFDTSRTVSSEDLNTILEAVRLAPTSYGFQPFHVTVVSDPDTTAKLRRAAYDQEQITSASHILVFSARPNISDRASNLFSALRRNGVPEEAVAKLEKFSKITNLIRTVTFSRTSWAAKQAYLALGIASLTAAELGIDGCPMEGFDAGKFAKILRLGDDLRPAVLFAIGYRSASDKARPKYRLPLRQLVTWHDNQAALI